MGNRYLVSRLNVTPTNAQDVLTLISATSRRIRLVEVSVVGRGTTSAAQQLQIGVTTTGTTPGGGITPSKAEHSEQPAAAFTTATTWAAQPSVAANNINLGWNALGGINRWVTPPGRPQGSLEARNGEVISLRFPVTAPTPQAMSLSVIVEED